MTANKPTIYRRQTAATAGREDHPHHRRTKQMEWTATQLRQLCTDNGVTFLQATANYGGRRWNLGGETFTINFQDGTYTTKDYGGNPIEKPYILQVHDYGTGKDKPPQLVIELSTYLSANVEVVEDTYEGWSAAFRKALDSQRYAQCRKHIGLGGVLKHFEKLLTEKLGTLGQVRQPKSKTFYSLYVVKGIGAVQFWNTHTADKLYIGPIKGIGGGDPGRGWGEIEFSPFSDDLESKAQEIVDKLRAAAQKHGTLAAPETPEPGPDDFAKVADQIVFDDYNHDPGDSRSCGSFDSTWNTPLGKLTYECVFDSGGDTQEDSWKLNGELLTENQGEWEQLACDLDIQPPHYYHGSKAIENWTFEGDNLPALLKCEVNG